MDEAIKYPVEVYLYDLSQGAARELSPGLLGRDLEGVWHSGVVVYGREYSFTRAGVISVIPGGFVLGEPQRIESLGETQLPYSVFLDFVLSLGDSKYKPGSWDLFKFNSNHFSDEVGQFLAGVGIPKFVLDLPQEITDTALWQKICKEWEENMTKSGSLAGVSLGLMTSRSMTSMTPAMGSGSLRSLSDNFIPRMIRDQESPELEELQAQIAALRADQLSLEERRNALNLTTKEEKRKKKKDKDDKKEKKEKKLRRKQLSEEGLIDSSEADTDRGGQARPLHLAAVCDQDESQSAVARDRSESAASQPPACDINSCRPSAPVTALAAGQPSIHSSDSGAGDLTKSGANKDSSSQCENHKSPNCSPTHSILSNHRSSDNRLSRVKSLKRVSFEEKPNIIDERTPEPLEVTQKADEVSCTADNCIREEVEDQPPPLEDVTQTISPSPRSPTPPPPVTSMASAEEQPLEIPTDGGDGEPVMPKKERKPHIKGITFRDFDHVKDFEDLVRTIVTLCSGEEQERLREMEDWIVKNEGTWVLSEGFNVFLSNVFHRQEWPSDARVAMLRLLAYGAKEDDIVLILHMDRKDHSVMNYAQSFDRLAVKEQESIALLFCNLFETASASEWLMYISEWDAPGGGLPLSNIRVTTKVAVNALLGDSPDLVNYGSALMANLGDKEVFDDVCSELAMAILQFFQGKPDEEKVWRCMKALLKFCTIGSREVPQLVKMIGPEPSKFSGLSKRVDELIEPIMARLASVPMF